MYEFDGICGQQYIDEFCIYIGITNDEFLEVLDKFVNKELFEKKDGKWIPKFKIGENL